MRLGGWWRLWIGLSLIWVLGACAFVFLVIDRPTRASVAESVGDTCDLGMPVPPELASAVREVPSLMKRLGALTDDEHAEERAPLIQKIKGTAEGLARYDGKDSEYVINVTSSKQGDIVLVLSTSEATDEEVFDQANRERHSWNSWNKFSDYCDSQLQKQAEDAIYPSQLKEWLLIALAMTLSIPLLLLIVGALAGWIRRGFGYSENS